MNEREALVALNMMEKVGPVSVRSLVATLGSATAIFQCNREALQQARGVGPEVAAALLDQRDRVDWAGELERASAAGARIITQLDEEYPRQLLQIHDPPLALYVKGTLQPRDKHGIAVVGTRHPSHYGGEVAERFAVQLSGAGFTVVSGLAEGIDTRAHQGALKAGGRTLAVIGSGMDTLYPASNRLLADRIAGQGAVMSEFPFGRKPDRTTFPLRNRIVSGLSQGIIVVEAGLKSGAMITANQALEQGRTVFAVPGRIDSAASQGCHALIRTGAVLVTGIEDVLAEYEFLMPSAGGPSPRPERPAVPLTDDERKLLEPLNGEELDVDTLIRLSGLKPATVGALLVSLEMKKLVKMLPGRRVARVGRG
jgi:DNA processing protein